MEKKNKLESMDQKILEHIQAHCPEYKIESVEDLFCALSDEETVHEEEHCRHRWWTTYLVVVKIGDKFIQYHDNRSDDGEDRGQEDEPEHVCEVEPYQKTVTAYRVKK